jgi:hypothetical protein
LLPLKPNETLTGVKLDKLGQVICAKYTTGTPRSTIDGIRAHLAKVKFIPLKEVPKRATKVPKDYSGRFRTESCFLTKVVKTIEESHHVLARIVLTMNQRLDLAESERKKLATKLGILSCNSGKKSG